MELDAAHVSEVPRRCVLGILVVTDDEESVFSCVGERRDQLFGLLGRVREDHRPIEPGFSRHCCRRLELVAYSSIEKDGCSQGRISYLRKNLRGLPVGERRDAYTG